GPMADTITHEEQASLRHLPEGESIVSFKTTQAVFTPGLEGRQNQGAITTQGYFVTRQSKGHAEFVAVVEPGIGHQHTPSVGRNQRLTLCLRLGRGVHGAMCECSS